MSSLSSTLTGFARNYGVASKKRGVRNKHSLRVQCSTLWTLQSTGGVSKATLDLTDAIGRKRVCSIGAKDYSKNDDVLDFTVIDHGGIHVLFESESPYGHTLDSPSILYITDVDSIADVSVDGTKISKGEKVICRPGSTITMGDVSFLVERNVRAHA